MLDGAGYKTAKTTRDREIAQINVLQGLGWRITRVWTMDWWDNSSKEIERLMKEIHAAEQDKASPQDNNDAVSSKPVQTALPEIIPQSPANEVKLKGVIQTLPQQREPVKTYRSKQLYTISMSADAFIDPYQGRHKEVARRILEVLEQEAPISESLLTRRVVQSFSIARSGSRIQQYMAGIYRTLKLKTTIQGEEKFYWKASQDPRTYADFRANGEGDCKRDAKEIPVQEAANAVCRALEEQFSLPQEDLVRAAANLMGINRIGTAVSALFLGAITWAERTGRIQKSDNGNWVLKE